MFITKINKPKEFNATKLTQMIWPKLFYISTPSELRQSYIDRMQCVLDDLLVQGIIS